MCIDPTGTYAAVTDNLGRVLLVDCLHHSVLRMWKGTPPGLTTPKSADSVCCRLSTSRVRMAACACGQEGGGN